MAGFKRATAAQAALKMAVYGPPGSGKTTLSLLIGEGLVAGKSSRVAVVDTEHGTDLYTRDVPERTWHPKGFDFDALYSRSITEVLTELKKLKPAEHSVIIIDSISHLWEACRLAYTGKTTRAGTIPMHAWATIKKPYKDLMHFILNCPQHVLLCGRQGNEYAEDESTGELKSMGYKMRAEGETPYEPHVLIRLEAVKVKQGSKVAAVPTAFVEKDRSGLLTGKVVEWPSYDTIAKPLLPLLGGSQAYIPSDDDVAQQDSEAIAKQEREREKRSAELLERFCARLKLATGKEHVEAIGNEITPAVKKEMLTPDLNKLRDAYSAAKEKFSGKVVYERVAEE